VSAFERVLCGSWQAVMKDNLIVLFFVQVFYDTFFISGAVGGESFLVQSDKTKALLSSLFLIIIEDFNKVVDRVI
jgi:hypothetical protein